MANRRTFNAQALSCNGVALRGLSRLTFTARYRNVIRSRLDGAAGTQDVNRTGLSVDVSIETSDVTKVLDALAATPGNTTFHVKESGTADWHHYTVTGIVLTGMRMTLNHTAHATMTLTGRVRFASGVSTLNNVLSVTSIDTTPPTLAYPVRLYRPHGLTFTPYGLPTYGPVHVQSVELSMDAVVHDDFGDLDIGITAVDVPGFNPMQVTVNHRDALIPGTLPSGTIAAAMADEAHGLLNVTLKESTQDANYDLAVENLLWTGMTENESEGYSEFTLNGEAGWRKVDGTTLNLNSDPKLFSIVAA